MENAKLEHLMNEGRRVQLNELKWLMVDEYQDFSQLFYSLIKAIRENNSDVKLFCVGDDWQAINAFAGSNLCYFADFRKYLDHFGNFFPPFLPLSKAILAILRPSPWLSL